MVIGRLKKSQILRFIAVGIVNTSFSYGIYAALLFIGFGYAFANLVALLIGILFSFKTQGYLVFHNPDNHLLGRFILSWTLIYLCMIGLMGWIIALGLDAYSAGALALPFSVSLSYLIQKHFVFCRSSQ